MGFLRKSSTAQPTENHYSDNSERLQFIPRASKSYNVSIYRNSVKVLHCLDYPSGIIRVEFDRALKFGVLPIQSLKLPPGAKVTSPIEISGQDISSNRDIYGMVSHVISCEPLGAYAVALGSISPLQILELEESWSMEGASAPSVPADTFPHLRDLTCYLPQYVDTWSLMHSCAVQLVRLSIQISSPQIDPLIYLLGLAFTLQELKLDIRLIPNDISTDYTSLHMAVPGLQRLELQIFGFLEEVALDFNSPLLNLFSILTVLYPGVNHCSISGISLRTPYVFSYLQSLLNIDYLSCRDVTDDLPYTKSIILPSLSVLSLDNPRILRHMTTPNLLRLEMFKISSTVELRGLGLHSLLKLYIYPRDHSTLAYHINPEEFPNLQVLSIDLRSRLHSWTLTSLPLLVSITITSGLLPSQHGNKLCVELIPDRKGKVFLAPKRHDCTIACHVTSSNLVDLS